MEQTPKHFLSQQNCEEAVLNALTLRVIYHAPESDNVLVLIDDSITFEAEAAPLQYLDTAIIKHPIGEGYNGVEVKSLDHAEKMFFESIEEQCGEVADIYQPAPPNDDGMIPLVEVINRNSSMVGMKTRRGLGNCITYHPDIEKELVDHGIFENTNNLYRFPTKNAPKDRIVVLYRGHDNEIDSGFYYSEVGDKKFYWEIPVNNSTLGQACDYVNIIKLPEGIAHEG